MRFHRWVWHRRHGRRWSRLTYLSLRPNKLLRRSIRRWSGFRFYFVARLLCRLLIFDTTPAVFHDRLWDRARNARRLTDLCCRTKFQGWQRDHVAVESWAFVSQILTALEPETLNRLGALSAQLVVAGALIYHDRIVVGDISDVDRLIDNGHVVLRRKDHCSADFGAKLLGRNEGVVLGPDIVIAVGPIPDASLTIELCFGW